MIQTRFIQEKRIKPLLSESACEQKSELIIQDNKNSERIEWYSEFLVIQVRFCQQEKSLSCLRFKKNKNYQEEQKSRNNYQTI